MSSYVRSPENSQTHVEENACKADQTEAESIGKLQMLVGELLIFVCFTTNHCLGLFQMRRAEVFTEYLEQKAEASGRELHWNNHHIHQRAAWTESTLHQGFSPNTSHISSHFCPKIKAIFLKFDDVQLLLIGVDFYF